ncbi:ATP-binding protein [Capnocytophaga sp. oral taxon 903]|uniref:ATP-binding protein n=1 Tax=Capnocytophaga sp. oral taxon 903 TaxID=2748317 RepID=UPI0015C1A200|nr:ATP-binding protein [Capnocytophaga sp. oral taxon 903]NWO28536.1 ATP-binding protein [Capnocytophaga sp. oral taxon 903]
MIIILNIFLALLLLLLLWSIIQTASLILVIKKVRKANSKEWNNIIIAFIKTRAERKVFYSFMATELTLAGGVIPEIPKIVFKFRHADTEANLWFELSQNSEWLSFGVAVLIAFGYFIYLWQSNKKKPEEWQRIVEACSLIDEEFNFIPTQKWFENQNTKQIKNLDKRYSENRNFPFEDMDFALASLHITDRFKPLLKEKIGEFRDTLRSFIINKEKEPSYSKILVQCRELVEKIESLSGTATSYIELRESVNGFLSIFNDFYYDSENNNRDEIRTKGYSIREYGYALQKVLSNSWIEFRKYHTIMVTGFAGTGKSHLIGDMVTQRKRAHEPSILLLGQHFTLSSDPLSQIRELLDIKCKKEKLLTQLNNYGRKIGEPVVIFIDAINEGAGDELWSKFLLDFLQEIDSCEYLRLVISFRISDRKNWFYDIAHDPAYAVYQHHGFKGYEREACEYMFSSFGIEQPTWPVYGEEFSNPLFLIKYCRNHERSQRPLVFTNFWTTILEYCDDTNHEIAISFKYNEAQNLVIKSLRSVAELMVKTGSRWKLEYQVVIKRLAQEAQYTRTPNDFFELLIDEGLLRTDVYNGVTYVNFGFERIGDYFIAEHLISNAPAKKWFKYNWGNLSEALAILVPSIKDKELIELVEKNDKEKALQSFIDSAMWRDLFTVKGDELICRIKEVNEYGLMFEIILSRPYRADVASNGFALYDMLWNLSMAQRDAIWTILISSPSSHQSSQLMDLARWGCEASENTLNSIDNQIAKACLETLVWALSTTWRELRDCATHAIVNILVQHKNLLLPLLEKYYFVNDPYIQERLWCAVYGALLLMEDDKNSCTVAQWVYSNVFIKKHVPEHILVRDYACNIVEFGISRGLDIGIEQELIKVPFTDGTLPPIPSNDEITAKYERDWKTVPDNEQDIYRAQLSILLSMAPNQGVRMYGDFGRYIFESNLREFGENVEMLSNWAIHMIFEEYGYDPKVFAFFDRKNTSRDRSHSKIERIGKKYQWIAMYRIMARMMDKYPDKGRSNEWFHPILGARTIDPTIYPGNKSLNHQSKYKLPDFDISKPKRDLKWLKAWKNMPKIKEYILVTDEKGFGWVNLFSYNNIIYEPDDDKSLIRDLWTFIQAYIVKKDDLSVVCNNLYYRGIEGRSFHENSDIYKVFFREFYWSSIYTETVKDEYYKRFSFFIGHEKFDNIMIEPTYLKYSLSEEDDVSFGSSINLLMPNEWLFKGLQLKYSNDTGVWINDKNEIVVLDNYMFSSGHSALLVRKDYLLNYLNTNGKAMFWPILTERMIRSKKMGYANYAQNGGYAYMDEKGIIHQKIRCYESSNIEKKYLKFKSLINKKTNIVLFWLHKHHFI